MKRGLSSVLLLILVVTSSLVISQPSSGVSEADYQKTQGLINNLTPIDSSGNINASGWAGYKSKAEERIDKINGVIKSKAPWLKLGFGMVPEISWLFLFNLIVWLNFLTYIVLNAWKIFSFTSLNKARLIGLMIFIILLVTKAMYYIAVLLNNIRGYFWNVLLPAGIIIAVVVVIILIILSIFAGPFLFRIFMMFWGGKGGKDGNIKQIEERAEHSTQTIEGFVKGMQGK